jgi:hypothetical protein
MSTIPMNPEERAIEAAKKRNDNHSAFSVATIVPRYLQGALYTIVFKDAQGKGFENYVYVPDNGEIEVYRNINQLAHAVSIHARSASLMEKVLTFGGMPGAIALIITATICYLTMFRADVKIPDVLSNALTMVLGFYFGSKVTKT